MTTIMGGGLRLSVRVLGGLVSGRLVLRTENRAPMTTKKALKPRERGFQGWLKFGLAVEWVAPRLPGPETPVGKPKVKPKPALARVGREVASSILEGLG